MSDTSACCLDKGREQCPLFGGQRFYVYTEQRNGLDLQTRCKVLYRVPRRVGEKGGRVVQVAPRVGCEDLCVYTHENYWKDLTFRFLAVRPATNWGTSKPGSRLALSLL